MLRPTLFMLLMSTPALAEVPRVVTDIPVTGSLVQMVMGDLGTPDVILPTGGDAHDYQLKPSQARALANAGLVVWIGPEMTPWLTRTVGDKGLTLLTTKGLTLRNYPEHGDEHDHDHDEEGHDHDEDHGDDHAHDHGHDHGHDEHDHHHHGVDPHAWLNPQNAALWLDAIAADLASNDPQNAATYKSNADAAKAKVDALDKDLATELAGAKEKPFIVYHDAYGYFTDHYGLPAALAVTGGSGGAPSAAQLSEIKAAAQSGVTCAFPEANHDARLINAAIEQSGVRLGDALDPEGSKVTQGADLYLEVMKNLGKNITDCIAGK